MNARSRSSLHPLGGAKLPKPGDLIAGKYQVDHKLGAGAMSEVFQVTHRVTQKRFALKALLPAIAAHDELAQRFLREAQVASRLEHPHVVEVYDVGAFAGSYFMVMELLQGETLDERLRREGTLSLSDIGRLLLPCMDALAEAHRAGIVHRDLKPANIFVCRATSGEVERAKVLDFGISKMAGPPGEPKHWMTRTGVVMGTPHYMPLEQMRGQPIDRRADIYALGVMIFQLRSGRLPYRAGNFGDLVLAMATEAPGALSDDPPGFAAVVQRAIARRPEDRYSDIESLLAALAPFLPAEPAQPPPPLQLMAADPSPAMPPPSSVKPSIRRPWLLAVAALLAALLAVASAVRFCGHPPAPTRLLQRSEASLEPPARPPQQVPETIERVLEPIEIRAAPLESLPAVEPVEPPSRHVWRPRRRLPASHLPPPPEPEPRRVDPPRRDGFNGRLPEVYEDEF